MLFFRLSRLMAALAAVALLLTSALSARAVIRDGGVDPSNLGQGGWLYIMSDATNKLGGNVASVTNESSLFAYTKSVGFNYVIVKAATSNTLWFGNYTFPQFTSNLVNAAHAQGLLIFASNRSWGNDIPGEIAIADYLFGLGADGYIWDAEAEWETSANNPWITNGPAQAWQLCSTIRAHWPTKFLAHNPFDTLYLHSTFPYKEFGYWSDAVMPQVYHHSASQGNAFAAIHWMDVNYRMFQNSLATLPTTNINGTLVNWTNAIKPLVLMRDVYGANFTTPYPPKDVRNFIDYLVADPNTVTTGGYQGSDYFRSELHDTNQWAYMKAATVGVFSNVVNNIVIDDPNATRAGAWTAVKTIDANTSTVTFSGATGTDTNSFGTNYLTKTKGTGSAYVQFTPHILTAGDYFVYHWHPFRADASATVPFVVICNTGTNTIVVNQQTNAGDWTLLGQYNFAPGTSGCIRVTDGFSEAGDVAMADGIKLTYIPPPVITLVLTNVTASSRQTGAIITWLTSFGATTQFQYGTTTNYGSFTAIDSALLTNHLVWLSGLNSNTTYYFRAVSTFGGTQYFSANYSFFTDPSVIVTSPQATYTGVWISDSSAPDKYSPSYQYASTAVGTDTAQATFRPTITLPGAYDVAIWYSANANRSASAPVTVSYPGGGFTAAVNMTANGGSWHLLGTSISLPAGTNTFVRVGNGSGESGKIVIADAVRYTYSAGQDAGYIGAVPVWWSNFYFGGGTGPNLDTDSDGYSAFSEYVLGTDPTNPNSRLNLSPQFLSGGGVALIFSPYQQGRLYQVQATDSLGADANWTTLSNLPVTINTNGQAVINVTNQPGKGKFLRLSVQLAP